MPKIDLLFSDRMLALLLLLGSWQSGVQVSAAQSVVTRKPAYGSNQSSYMQTSNHLPDPRSSITTPVNTKGQAGSFFICQYRSKYNPEANNNNGNCGPATLAMVAEYFKVARAKNVEKLVELARVKMTGRNNLREFTDIVNVIRGAREMGLQAAHVWNINSMDDALLAGAILVVSGSPSVPGSYGQRLKGYSHCRGGHFIVIAGLESSKYIMNDPECPSGPRKISRQELRRFMAFFPEGQEHGAVAIWR